MFAILFDEDCKVFCCAGAGVCQRLALAASGEELDGGEALDFIRDIIGGCVNFGDDDFGISGVLRSQIVVFRGKTGRMLGFYNDRGHSQKTYALQ